jgi:mycothiol synthase
MERADVGSVHELIRQCEAADSSPIVTAFEEIDEIFDEPHFDNARDSRVIEASGSIVGWGRIYHNPSGVDHERAYVEGAVHPAWRRRGLGKELLGWQINRAREAMGRHDNGLERFIRASTYDWRQDAHALFEAAGMSVVRFNDELIRPLENLPVPGQPHGIRIERWGPEHTEPTRIVVNSAFADHWGSTPHDPDAWVSNLTSYGTRLDLSFVAVAEGEVVGTACNFHIAEDQEITGRIDGWIGIVGVVKPWRKRGVASALIVESLHAFAEAGFTHAMIGVDSENPSGAYGLYQSLGFEPLHRSVTHQLEV